MKRGYDALKRDILLKAMQKILLWDEQGRVIWGRIDGVGNSAEPRHDDFAAADNALAKDDFQGGIIIQLGRDGTALVGWNLKDYADDVEYGFRF